MWVQFASLSFALVVIFVATLYLTSSLLTSTSSEFSGDVPNTLSPLKSECRISVSQHGRRYPVFNILESIFLGAPQECQLRAFGSDDDEKHLCSGLINMNHSRHDNLAASSKLEGRQCSVVSIGGNNKWAFELDVLRNTPCFIHTFDCTVEPDVPSELESSGRFKFMKACLGSVSKSDNIKERKFLTWRQIAEYATERGARSIGLLKMDIEGWEYDAILQIRDVEEIYRPLQLAVELHLATFTAYEAPEFVPVPSNPTTSAYPKRTFHQFIVNELPKAGYAIADRNDNPFCAHCSEILLLHKNVYGEYWKCLNSITFG